MGDKRTVVILCRSRHPTVEVNKLSVKGFLSWGSHIKHKYITNRLPQTSNPTNLQTIIENNVTKPEWIGNHRFGVFDLLNYVQNDYRYVYDPASQPTFFDPIGIPSITSLHLHSYFLKHGYNSINVDNYDENGGQLIRVLKNGPAAVMISATFLSAQQLHEITASIHRASSDIPIIIGSSFLLTRLDAGGRLIPEYERLIKKNVYVVIEDQGMDTADALLQRLSSKSSVADLPNIAYSDNGMVQYSEKVLTTHDIDHDYPEWSSLGNIARNVAFLRTSQGCAYNCKFCSFPGAVSGFKQRSLESIRAELREIHQMGIRYFAFTDDHFAINHKRINDICTMMLEEGFDFTWFAGIRATSITEENAELLARAGCRLLCVGLESGDDRILHLMNKKTTASGNMRCLEILDKYGIVAYGSFIVGFPGETEESVENTIRWINSSPLRLYKVFMFYLLQGAPIYDEQEAHHITFFGNSYNHSLWKTPTMDALRASEIVKEFILKVNSKTALIYAYSPMYAFFPFLLKGYSLNESLRFLQLHTDLIKNELSPISVFLKARERAVSLRKIATLLKHD